MAAGKRDHPSTSRAFQEDRTREGGAGHQRRDQRGDPLVQHEVLGHQIRCASTWRRRLPPVLGDRVQLQQVIINLIVNGIEAMTSVTDRQRELVIRSQLDEADRCLSRSTMPASASTRRTPSGFSTPSSPPNPAAWAWDCRSAARSSRPMADGCPPPTIPGRGRRFNSPCRRGLGSDDRRRRCDAPPSAVKPTGTLSGSPSFPRGSLPEKSARPLRPFLRRARPTRGRFPMGLHLFVEVLTVRRRPQIGSGKLYAEIHPIFVVSLDIQGRGCGYSSQIACTRAGSQYVSVYSALTSGPKEPWPNGLSKTASGAPKRYFSGSGAFCERRIDGQYVMANFASA